MTKLELLKWNAEKAGLSVMASAICGKTIPVRDVEREDAVAYTGKDGIIRLSRDHKLFDGLSEAEKIAARRGICAHEVLHLVKTDFYAMEMAMKRIPEFERPIFAHLNNIIEDCAIEAQAEDTIGGTTLESLDFIIGHTYNVSPNLEEAEYAFGQYLIALGEFGDLGMPKGHFTFPEAKQIFIKTSPIFKRAIEETNGALRVKYSKDIFELSRSLWQDIAKQNKTQYENMMKSLEELMKKLGATETKGKGAGKDSREGSRSSSDKKKKRQKISIEIITEEEKQRLLEEMKKMKEKSGGSSGEEGGSSGSPGSSSSGDSLGESSGCTGILSDELGEGSTASGDLHLLMTEEDLKKQLEAIENAAKEFSEVESEGVSKNEENGESNENSSTDGNEKTENGEDSEEKGSGSENPIDMNLNETLDESDSDHNSRGSNDASKKTYNGSTMHSEKANAGTKPDDSEKMGMPEITEEEYTLDSECAEQIMREMKSAIESFEKEMKASDDEVGLDLDDIKINSAHFENATCKNRKVEVSDAERLSIGYEQLKEEMSSGIKSLTKQFERIFMNDTEELMYKNSGRTNINRMYGSKVTSRIFEKKRYPSDKDNFVVFLLIDESGSMGGLKAQIARNTAISFAEVFGKLNIPLYVMGFTADCGADAVHNHYIRWKNTSATRLRLMDISARSNNFDGYSIRYATEILKKKQAKHKLLIVVSDGSPACYKYYNDGIEDTKDAIRQAKKVASVMGVGIGGVNTNIFMNMYGNDFLHIENVTTLYTGISKKMTKLIKEWE